MLVISMLDRGVVVSDGAADCDEQPAMVARPRGRVALTQAGDALESATLTARWSTSVSVATRHQEGVKNTGSHFEGDGVTYPNSTSPRRIALISACHIRRAEHAARGAPRSLDACVGHAQAGASLCGRQTIDQRLQDGALP
jgi:hypothetical protein